MHLALLAVLAAAPVQLVSPGFTGVNVEAKALSFYGDHFAQQLARPGLRVTTSAEISAALGLERQKQLLGCESESCMAEIGNALGAEGLIVGSVGRFDDGLQVNVKIITAASASVVASFSRKVPTEGKVLDALADAAKAMAPLVLDAFARPSAPSATVQPAPTVDAGPPPVACREGAACKSVADCCKGTGCDAATHRCTPATAAYGYFSEGQLCEFHDQCLFGVCSKGTCRSPPTCHGVRSDCGAGAACCASTKASCQGGFCCLPAGERCRFDNGCCSGSCADGKCE